MDKLVRSCDDSFYKLARTEVKDDILQYIMECNKKNVFPTALNIDSYLFNKYKEKVQHPIELSGLARDILKEMGIIDCKEREDKVLGYFVLGKN
jgi:hypothetical protein